MSGIYLLGLMAIWLFVGWILYKFWRATKSPIKDLSKTAYYIFGMVLFAIWFGSGFWPFAGKKMYYDAQVMAMCEKDGGVTVYETVELPAEKFDKWGNVNLTGEEYTKQSEEYFSTASEILIREDDPKIIRFTLAITRKTDKKILGKAIRYGRSGGDLPGFWHPSSYGCPPRKESIGRLESSVFKKGAK
ncbi:MAG: hypothetical protein KZQ94_01245 [Candidatus Thiodiazotropha sp. (ex Troendleina suluensis)]|nr:hypothetical protein [Candidatus Thiodiazotropha sp. (ex Troendleina suluensis)]